MGVNCDQLLGLSRSSSNSCWYTCVKSSVLKHWPPERDAKMSSGFGMRCWSTSKAGFTVTLKSPQSPSVLGTGTMGVSQQLNSTLVSTPSSSRRSNSRASASLMAKGTGLGRQTLAGHVPSPTGELVGSVQFQAPDETLFHLELLQASPNCGSSSSRFMPPTEW